MKPQWLLVCTLFLFTVGRSCEKDKPCFDISAIPGSFTSSGRVASFSQKTSVACFFSLAWRQTAGGQEKKLESKRLTKEAINKGVEVFLYLESGQTDDPQLPYTETSRKLEFLYILLYPASIDVVATGPNLISYKSEVHTLRPRPGLRPSVLVLRKHPSVYAFSC